MLMSWVEGYGIRMFVLRSVNHILFITRPLVSCHGSDVVGCAQPSERSARHIACPYRAVLESEITPRWASMASAARQMIGDATLGPEIGPGCMCTRIGAQARLSACTLLPSLSTQEASTMCGIVGAVSTRNIVPILVQGLQRLEYRGYDSCGGAVHAASRHAPHRGAGLQRARSTARVAELLQQVQAEHIDGATGIAHTRWATHGAPAQHNAHPHFSHGRGHAGATAGSARDAAGRAGDA